MNTSPKHSTDMSSHNHQHDENFAIDKHIDKIINHAPIGQREAINDTTKNEAKNILNTQKNIESSDTTDVYEITDDHMKPYGHIAPTDPILQQKEYHFLQESDDIIQRATSFPIKSVSQDMQDQYNIVLDKECNGYHIDYATKTILPLAYLPLEERKQKRGVGTAILSWIVEDAKQTLGDDFEVVSVWKEGDNKFDENANLHAINQSLHKGVKNIDELIGSTPVGKIFGRLGVTPYRVLYKMNKNRCVQMVVQYRTTSK